MNKNELISVMKRFGETQSDLAEVLGISPSRLNAKINNTENAQFTQHEIYLIAEHYELTPEQIKVIFFNSDVSRKRTFEGVET